MSKAKASSAAYTIQSADRPKGVDRRRQVDIRMIGSVLLVWLDRDIDKNNSAWRDSINYLRRVVYTVETFTDAEECIDFLGDVADEKVCMIVSESLAQQIVPLVHNMSQVNTIFISLSNQNHHVEWATHWPKIKSVSAKISSTSKAVKQAAQQCDPLQHH